LFLKVLGLESCVWGSPVKYASFSDSMQRRAGTYKDVLVLTRSCVDCDGEQRMKKTYHKFKRDSTSLL
jgi:hypothetical protein